LIYAVIFLTFTACKDQGSVPSAIHAIPGISASLDSVFVYPTDTVQVNLAGGVPPYAIVTSPSSNATVNLSGTTLIITGVSNGQTTVTAGDASSSQHIRVIGITVETKVSFAASIQPIFVGSYGCAGSVGGCHGGTMGLTLDDATTSYQNLVNVSAQSAGFQGLNRVTPRNLQRSLLYIRVSSNDPNISMPRGRTLPFDATMLSNVRAWILQGARLN
jgi:hypothetical protein